VLLAMVALAGCGTTAEEHFARAREYEKQGKDPEAAVEYLRTIEEQPQHGDAHYRLAQAYERIGDSANAAKSYIRAADILNDNAEVQLKGGTMLLLNKRFEEARTRANRALSIDPRNIPAQILLAHALSAMRQTGPALAAIQKAIELDPTRGGTYADFAMFQFSTGSFEQGETNLKKAADATPPTAMAQMTLASLYWAQGRLDEAEVYLKRAVETDVTGVRASRALATFYLGNNRADEAEQHLKTIADRTRSIASRLALADYYITLRKPDQARLLLNQLATEAPSYDAARSRLAALLYADGKRDDAHAFLDATLGEKPDSARARLTKASFLLAEHKLDEAVTQLKAALAADAASVQAHYLLASIYAARQDPVSAAAEFNQILSIDPDSVPAMMELARLNLAAGRSEVAAQFAQQAVDARPSVDTALLLARTLVGRREISRAEIVLRPYLANATSADVLTTAGEVYVGIGESQRGRALIERAAALNPDDPVPVESLVALDLNEGNLRGARATIEPRLMRRPKDSRLLVLGARVAGSGGDSARMAELLKAAVENDPNNTMAYALLGQLYATQGKLEDALREYDRITARDPRSVPAHTMAAMILEGLGRIDDAQKRYQRVLDIDARAGVASNNLAWLYAAHGGNLDQALQLAQTAKESMPETPDVNDTLAWIYYRKELPEMALPPLRIAVERQPANAVYHYHQGLVYMKTGDLDSARESLEKALKLDPRFSGAEDARKALQQLP
jgi:Tfp pilus assembly protein PilF